MADVIDITKLDQKKIDKICQTLDKGQIIAYPTDTIYGLGVNAMDTEAATKLFQAKRRSKENPVSILFPSIEELKQYFPNLNSFQQKCVERLLPGAVTLILPLSPRTQFPAYFQKEGYTGVRIIEHPSLNKILDKYKVPISTTSVNPHNQPPAQNIDEIKSYFEEELSLILKDKRPKQSKPSTIIKLADTSYKLLREGSIPARKIERTISELK